jgi:hypothetical protein
MKPRGTEKDEFGRDIRPGSVDPEPTSAPTTRMGMDMGMGGFEMAQPQCQWDGAQGSGSRNDGGIEGVGETRGQEEPDGETVDPEKEGSPVSDERSVGSTGKMQKVGDRCVLFDCDLSRDVRCILCCIFKLSPLIYSPLTPIILRSRVRVGSRRVGVALALRPSLCTQIGGTKRRSRTGCANM